MSTAAILVVPACEKGRGGGHLVRSLALAGSLRTNGSRAFLCLPASEGGNSALFQETALLGGDFDLSWIVSPDEAEKRAWDLIILDRFQTPTTEFSHWASLAPVIGIDEGGPCRKNFDFLIDLLPGLPGCSPPNLCCPALLPLPVNRRSSFSMTNPPSGPLYRVLVSFGVEDPVGLSSLLCRALAAEAPNLGFPGCEISILMPPRAGNQSAGTRLPAELPVGIRVLSSQPNLREQLAAYDVLITHFGLTAFEAIHARLPVLLLSPSSYHERLARNAGFFSVGIGRKGVRRLVDLLVPRRSDSVPIGLSSGFMKNLERTCADIAARYGLEEAPAGKGLASLFSGSVPLSHPSCPVCGTGARSVHPVLARFPDRTYRRCSHCGMVYMNRINPALIEYSQDYFFALYKKQYGKTYLEDFPHLVEMGKVRLAHIRSLRPTGGRLLDIGCAYGPFLAAARKERYFPIGLDPAEDAVAYVRDTLRIPAFSGFFPDGVPSELSTPESFEVVSLWYVIEHFEEPRKVLFEIHRLLKAGGVLAFSTPSGSGISARKGQKRFLKKSPSDHWTIWSPRYCRRLLRRVGFRLCKIISTGHHPERFPLAGGFLAGEKGLLYRLFLRISRTFRLGDTFEVYAVKDQGRRRLPGEDI